MRRETRNKIKGAIIGTVIGLTIVIGAFYRIIKWDDSRTAKEQLVRDVSEKGTDAEWLYRLEEISDEEWEELKDYSAQKPTLQELDDYLDTLLGNRKNEYFIKRVMQ